VAISLAEFQIPESKLPLKSKFLDVKTSSFCHWDFELDLTFELCHLSLSSIWDLGFPFLGLPRREVLYLTRSALIANIMN
jgi:hypothetical protein